MTTSQTGGPEMATNMHVHESGTRGAPAVVFLHGAGASGQMWRDHVARLADRFHCLAPDLPGFGRSNHLAPLTVDETADLIAELIETRVPARRAHVVGLSWGGGVAHTAAEPPPRARRPGGHRQRRRPHVAGRRARPARGHGDLALPSHAPGGRHVQPASSGWTRRAGPTCARRRAGRSGARSWRASRAASRSVELNAMSPTLLTAGEAESVIRPSNAAQAALMPHAEARFAPGVGHGWLARRTELHVRMVEAWLTGQDLPAELAAEKAWPGAVERMRRELEKEGRRGDHRLAARSR